MLLSFTDVMYHYLSPVSNLKSLFEIQEETVLCILREYMGSDRHTCFLLVLKYPVLDTLKQWQLFKSQTKYGCEIQSPCGSKHASYNVFYDVMPSSLVEI
jgi:hypothetical protein